MKCKYCGQEILDNENYCKNCGARVEKETFVGEEKVEVVKEEKKQNIINSRRNNKKNNYSNRSNVSKKTK